DHLKSHKMEGIEELSVATGARVEYLPPYSPDFNPIEMLWSTVRISEPTNQPREENPAKSGFMRWPKREMAVSISCVVWLRSYSKNSRGIVGT
ncbi:MAG: transposase, partial [Hormoscilla sp. GM102CHS1]|nr:transposase [Hormoscilla sp. GM102CHS1]